MNEDKLIDAVVRAISGLEDSLKDEVNTLRSDVRSINIEVQSINTEVQTLRADINTNNQNLINTFNLWSNAMLKKLEEFTTEQRETRNELKGLRQDFKEVADLADRVKRLEDTVFKKGA
jgi:deoxyribodipyrimidine photolyase